MWKRHRSDSPDEVNGYDHDGAHRRGLARMLKIAWDQRDAAVNREARAKAEESQHNPEPRSTAEAGPGTNTNPIDLTASPSRSLTRSLSGSSKSREKDRSGCGSFGGSDDSPSSERALPMMWVNEEEGREALASEEESRAERKRVFEARAITEHGRGQAKDSVQPTKSPNRQGMRPLVGVIIPVYTKKRTRDKETSFSTCADEKGGDTAKEQASPTSSEALAWLDSLPTMIFPPTNLDPFFGLTIPRESPPRDSPIE